MNGPQHYTRAQQLLASVTYEGTHPDGSPVVREDGEATNAALAGIGHAILALTAATAGGALDRTGWMNALFGNEPGDPGPGAHDNLSGSPRRDS